MKAFAIWLVVVAAVFGVFALVTDRVRGTKQVFVVVDTSFPMKAVWFDIPGVLDELDDEHRAEFALATEKARVHGWQSTLDLVGVEPFAPCDFSEIESYSEVDQADELVLVTTPTSCDTSALTGWRIVEIGQ